MMKSRIKIVIISIAMILIIMMLPGCSVINSRKESGILTEEEIINIFKENREVFVAAAESLEVQMGTGGANEVQMCKWVCKWGRA